MGDITNWLVLAAAVALVAVWMAIFLFRKRKARREAELRRRVEEVAEANHNANRQAARNAAAAQQEIAQAALAREIADRDAAEKAAEAARLEKERSAAAAARTKAANDASDMAARALDTQRRHFQIERDKAVEEARKAAEEARKAAEEARKAAEAKARVVPTTPPIASHDPPPIRAPRQDQPKDPSETLVLIADDSKVVRFKTGRLLEAHHYKVAFALDGVGAVAQLEANRPDIVITDVEMPEMDGFQLTRHIRSDPATAGIPIIMITAAEDRHRHEADEAGVSVLLGKPYSDDDLMGFIRTAMQSAAADGH